MSDAVFAIFQRYTPQIEPLSIDEAFLDVTGSLRLFGTAVEIARRIKQEIRTETGLTASIGVAPNKFLAKLASDLEKPDGLTVLRREDLDRVLPPLPIGKIWGIGPKTASKLRGLGVHTFGDLRKLDPDVLARRLGDDGEHFRRLALGLDEREVIPDHDAKSIGQEQTFGVDSTDPAEVRQVMLEQCEQVGQRLRRHGLLARGVTVKIRFGDFQTITRRCTLDAPTDGTLQLWHAARDLFDRWAAKEFSPVRLIGVSANQLSRGQGQLDLFPDPKQERQRKVDRAMDQINRKFGNPAIRRSMGK